MSAVENKGGGAFTGLPGVGGVGRESVEKLGQWQLDLDTFDVLPAPSRPSSSCSFFCDFRLAYVNSIFSLMKAKFTLRTGVCVPVC